MEAGGTQDNEEGAITSRKRVTARDLVREQVLSAAADGREDAFGSDSESGDDDEHQPGSAGGSRGGRSGSADDSRVARRGLPRQSDVDALAYDEEQQAIREAFLASAGNTARLAAASGTAAAPPVRTREDEQAATGPSTVRADAAVPRAVLAAGGVDMAILLGGSAGTGAGAEDDGDGAADGLGGLLRPRKRSARSLRSGMARNAQRWLESKQGREELKALGSQDRQQLARYLSAGPSDEGDAFLRAFLLGGAWRKEQPGDFDRENDRGRGRGAFGQRGGAGASHEGEYEEGGEEDEDEDGGGIDGALKLV